MHKLVTKLYHFPATRAVDPWRCRQRDGNQPETCWWHTAPSAVCHQTIIQTSPALKSRTSGINWSALDRASSPVHHHIHTPGAYAPAECSDCVATVSMDWRARHLSHAFDQIEPTNTTQHTNDDGHRPDPVGPTSKFHQAECWILEIGVPDSSGAPGLVHSGRRRA